MWQLQFDILWNRVEPKGKGMKREAPAVLSRRDLGRAALAVSVTTLLAGCSGKESAEKAAPTAPAAPDSLARSRCCAAVEGSRS